MALPKSLDRFSTGSGTEINHKESIERTAREYGKFYIYHKAIATINVITRMSLVTDSEKIAEIIQVIKAAEAVKCDPSIPVEPERYYPF